MKKKQANILFTTLTSVTLVIAGCGGGGGGGDSPATAAPAPTTTPPTAIAGSSASSSGSTGVYTKDGASYALTPASGSSAKLLALPNTGSAVGVLTVANVSSTPISTSLPKVDGTSVDPVNNVGMAFAYGSGKISIFGLPSHPTKPNAEISTYDTLTTNYISYSGATATISGAVMNTANKTLVIATADGFEIVDYSNPAALTKLREIPSLQANPTAGVEVMENFAFDPKLPVAGTDHAMIITGGRMSSKAADPVMTLVDANTGTVYKPDAATAALFTVSWYIDAAAVDTTYHVAVLADEGAGTTFVDLTKLTLNATSGTYTLPSTAVNRITTYAEYDNLAIESTKHLVMMGAGYGGTSMVVGLLKDPAVGLGFSKEAKVTMPTGTDDTGATVYWYGSYDPHGAGAYITDPSHPTYTTPTALGLWVNGAGNHIAIIDLKGVLDGTLAGGTYNPAATTPKDIAYFKIP